MGPTQIHAVILLDIDGVLNPQVVWDSRNGLSGPSLLLSEAHLALVQDLNTLGQIAWASTWSKDQTSRLETAIGLPADTPSLDFTQTRVDFLSTAGPTWKIPFVERWLRRRERIEERSYQAVVWIDDELYEDADMWAHASSAPTLLIRTDPDTGLTMTDVAVIRTFLADAESFLISNGANR